MRRKYFSIYFSKIKHLDSLMPSFLDCRVCSNMESFKPQVPLDLFWGLVLAFTTSSRA